ncbi:MAG: DNA repair protein RecO [Lachnospiraceae bacterium]|nr:DNA repair protein RecO [Lachnospiraceae bacterium]
MREAIELSGVVLQAQPVGEYDRRLVILTRERGKITVFAHGARRPKSTLISATAPFVFAVFTMYEGRDAYTLVSADVKEYFTGLSGKMPGVLYGFYFLELASYYTREGLEAGGIVNLLYVTCLALLREQMPIPMIRAVCELRMLAENGEYALPEPDCGLDTGVLAAMYHVCRTPVSRLFAFALEEEKQNAFIREVTREMKRAVDKNFKSLAVIDEMY